MPNVSVNKHSRVRLSAIELAAKKKKIREIREANIQKNYITNIVVLRLMRDLEPQTNPRVQALHKLNCLGPPLPEGSNWADYTRLVNEFDKDYYFLNDPNKVPLC